jgi:hypothetical protein
MKVIFVSAILMLVVYAQAASIPEVNDIKEVQTLENSDGSESNSVLKNLVIKVEPPGKVDQTSTELTREKRQFGFGGFGIPGIGFGYAPGFGYGGGHGTFGGYPGGYGGYPGGYGGYPGGYGGYPGGYGGYGKKKIKNRSRFQCYWLNKCRSLTLHQVQNSVESR